MANSTLSWERAAFVAPATYEIRVKAHLDGGHWSEWFDGMLVTSCEGGDTVLYGKLADQSALYGLLSRLRDLALPLVAVRQVE